MMLANSKIPLVIAMTWFCLCCNMGKTVCRTKVHQQQKPWLLVPRWLLSMSVQLSPAAVIELTIMQLFCMSAMHHKLQDTGAVVLLHMSSWMFFGSVIATSSTLSNWQWHTHPTALWPRIWKQHVHHCNVVNSLLAAEEVAYHHFCQLLHSSMGENHPACPSPTVIIDCWNMMEYDSVQAHQCSWVCCSMHTCQCSCPLGNLWISSC